MKSINKLLNKDELSILLFSYFNIISEKEAIEEKYYMKEDLKNRLFKDGMTIDEIKLHNEIESEIKNIMNKISIDRDEKEKERRETEYKILSLIPRENLWMIIELNFDDNNSKKYVIRKTFYRNVYQKQLDFKTFEDFEKETAAALKSLESE